MQTLSGAVLKELAKVISEEIKDREEKILGGALDENSYKVLTAERRVLLNFDEYVETARKNAEKREK